MSSDMFTGHVTNKASTYHLILLFFPCHHPSSFFHVCVTHDTATSLYNSHQLPCHHSMDVSIDHLHLELSVVYFVWET
jgi:hypothetical protein